MSAVLTRPTPRVTARRQVTFAARMNGEIRAAKYNDADYLVVPTIAIMEGVVWPFASETKELVLASELEKMDVRSWNGRPVTMDHPSKDGRLVPANEPDVLDKFLFGYVFNAGMEDKKLAVESWLSLDRALKLGKDAQRVLSRARSKEPIEVSVGVIITPEESSGTYNGEDYDIIWRDIIAEHLAMLPEDTIGACSVEMGCGAPRAAKAFYIHRFDSDKIVVEERTPIAATGAMKTLTQRVLEKFKLRTAAIVETGPSASETHSELWNLLFAEEPAFAGIWDIFPEDNLVVYGCAPNDQFHLYRRKFSVDGDGKYSLVGQRKEVEPVTRYETTEASPASVTANAAPCGCNKETNMSADRKARVKALIDSKKNGFTAASAAVLETLTDDQLKAMEDAEATMPEPQATTPTTTPTSPSPTPGQPGTGTTSPAPSPSPTPGTPGTGTSNEAPRQMTAEEWRRTAPPEIVAVVDDKIAQDKAERTQTVAALKGKQSVYTEAELNVMPLPELRKVAALAGASTPSVDYSFRGVPRSNANNEETVPAPRRLADVLTKKKAS